MAPAPDLFSTGGRYHNSSLHHLLFISGPFHHLPYLPTVLERLAKIDGFCVATGDIRHFFHQIKITEQLQRYFGVALGDEFFAWTQIPMGFSHSPWIAQSLALLILLFREDDENPFFEEPLDLQQLPDYLNIKSVDGHDDGFIVVYYDNILLVAKYSHIGTKIFNRIAGNFTIFNVVMGTWTFLSPKDLRTSTFEYLGAEIRLARKSDRDTKRHFRSSWQVKSSKVPTSLPCRKILITPRSVARVIGKIVWHHTLRLIPFATIYKLIDILRYAALHQRKTNWDDKSLQFSDEQWLDLKQAAQQLLYNNWIFSEMIDYTSDIFVASDSSDGGWGYAILEDDGSGAEHGFLWSSTEIKMHIFLKELLAACQTIKTLLLSCSNIIIAIDNTAAAHAIQQLYSSNSMANVHLEMLAKHLVEAKCKVTVVSVRSIDNAADAPSRGKHTDLETRLRCRSIMNDKLCGINKSFENSLLPAATNNRVRHSEHPFDDLVDEILECEV